MKTIKKLSAGYKHALILKENGSLYGIGSNLSGQIGDLNDSNITEPFLMAKQVKAMAAGYNYSIYVTKNGNVKMIGNGEYADNLLKFENADDVYADPSENSFAVMDNYGKWSWFGQKQCEDKVEKKIKCVYQYPVENVSGSFPLNGSTGPQNAFLKSGIGRIIGEVEYFKMSHIRYSDIFKDLCYTYGSNNLRIELNPIGEIKYTLESYSCEYEVKCAPRVLCTNEYVYERYQPIPFSGNRDIPKLGLQNVKKTMSTNKYIYVLDDYDKLSVVNRDDEKIISKLSGIIDMSITEYIITILKKDGSILYGGHKQVQSLQDDWDAKYLQTFVL